MNLYNVTFNLLKEKDLSMAMIGHTARHAKKSVTRLFMLLNTPKPTSIKTNVVVFGVDGSGKSLNKLKKKR